MSVQSQECERSCNCMLGVSIAPLPAIFLLNVRAVQTVWYILFSILLQSHNVETDPPNTIHEITNTYPNNAESPFYGKQKIKPMAKLVFTKTKEVCKSKEVDDSSEDTNAADLIEMMKKKMMMKKKIGKCQI